MPNSQTDHAVALLYTYYITQTLFYFIVKVQLEINVTGTDLFPTSVIEIHDGHKLTDPVLAYFR